MKAKHRLLLPVTPLIALIDQLLCMEVEQVHLTFFGALQRRCQFYEQGL